MKAAVNFSVIDSDTGPVIEVGVLRDRVMALGIPPMMENMVEICGFFSLCPFFEEPHFLPLNLFAPEYLLLARQTTTLGSAVTK